MKQAIAKAAIIMLRIFNAASMRYSWVASPRLDWLYLTLHDIKCWAKYGSPFSNIFKPRKPRF